MATIPAGNRTVSVLAVDLNNDGVPDIVATNQGGMDKGTITVALGLGKGKFAAPTTYTLGDVGPYETIAADFNGDGYLDLAVVLFGTSDRTIVGTQVDVFINTGKGTFKPFVAYATGTKPRAVIAADLNKDGKLDLIVANSTANTVGVLLGKGDGTFGPRVDYPAGNNPHGLAVADFNHDGRLDVAVANNGPVGAINVMFGKGDGTLEAPITYSAGAGTFGLAAGDLNGDGYPRHRYQQSTLQDGKRSDQRGRRYLQEAGGTRCRGRSGGHRPGRYERRWQSGHIVFVERRRCYRGVSGQRRRHFSGPDFRRYRRWVLWFRGG